MKPHRRQRTRMTTVYAKGRTAGYIYEEHSLVGKVWSVQCILDGKTEDIGRTTEGMNAAKAMIMQHLR